MPINNYLVLQDFIVSKLKTDIPTYKNVILSASEADLINKYKEKNIIISVAYGGDITSEAGGGTINTYVQQLWVVSVYIKSFCTITKKAKLINKAGEVMLLVRNALVNYTPILESSPLRQTVKGGYTKPVFLNEATIYSLTFENKLRLKG